MNKHKAHSGHLQPQDMNISHEDAIEFLEEMVRLDELVEYVNHRINEVSERWNDLMEKAGRVYEAEKRKEKRLCYSPAQCGKGFCD